MGKRFKFTIMFILCTLWIHGVGSIIDIPGLPDDPLVHLGDINIAALVPVHHWSPDQPCGTSIRGIGAMQHVHAVSRAVQMVNEDESLLPGTTLGYVIFDDCGSDTTALAHIVQSLSPRSDTSPDPFYDVFGIVGPFHSSGSLIVGRYLQLIHMPFVSPTATNDGLSDPEKYKYFFRVVPPDKYQAKAMIELVTHFNWSYISTVNSEGVYGRNGINQVHELAEQYGICIAVSKEIKLTNTAQDFDHVVESLLRFENSRVVVMFVNEVEGKGLLQALHRARVYGRFVLIFSDTFNQRHHMAGFENVAHGAFAIDLYIRKQPQEIVDHFVHPRLYGGNNHFYKEFWDTYYNCSFLDLGANCSEMSLDSYVPLIIDSVLTLSHAAHTLLQHQCPDSNCLKDHSLLPYIRNVSFNGTSEHIRFNAEGDILARYRYKHFTKLTDGNYALDYVGRWDMAEDAVTIDYDSVQWPGQTIHDTNKHITSVCSLPCLPGHYIVLSEVVCCWECHPCHANEITNSNASTCQDCPMFFWPDQLTKSYCEEIPSSYIQLSDSAALPIFIAGLLGAVLVIITDGFFIHFRANR